MTPKETTLIQTSSRMAHHALMLARNCSIVEDRMLNGTDPSVLLDFIHKDWVAFHTAYQQYVEANNGA